jgi:SAM-dependent methyltransferase
MRVLAPVTLFLAAFLLFQVQPVLGKFILPWFGGTPEVWTACMMVFQTLLLAGYAYAHASTRYLAPRSAAALHLLLLVAALATLPITPAEAFRPVGAGAPVLRIVLLLVASVGLPFLVLAATAPLLQAWIAARRPDRPPYRLYAVSNAGSLLGLLAYPFVVEPALGRESQTVAWSVGLGLFALACGAFAVDVFRKAPPPLPAPAATGEEAAPGRSAQILWLALPAAGSVVLLSVTNTISQDLAVVPLLWVLPLALYLVSFILAFDHPRWYVRTVWIPAAALAGSASAYVQGYDSPLGLLGQSGVHVAALLAVCVVCHGELAALAPPAHRLTRYYLFLAIGGAAGGILVAAGAPLAFDGYLELPLGYAAACFAALAAAVARPRLHRFPRTHALSLAGGAAAAVTFAALALAPPSGVLERSRSFYGVITIREYGTGDPARHRRVMQNGRIVHGLQFLAPDRRARPGSYYGPDSGIGRLLARELPGDARRIAVVGLGTGTIAGWTLPGDTIRFYEINPDVERLARRWFTWLDDAPGRVEVVLGDARLALERERPNDYDVLAIDAFTGDAVPVHLLTVEAVRLYLRHLRPDGILAMHVSNLHLDLRSLALREAALLERAACVVDDIPDLDEDTSSSTWVLIAARPALFDRPGLRGACDPAPARSVAPWTDSRASILDVLH